MFLREKTQNPTALNSVGATHCKRIKWEVEHHRCSNSKPEYFSHSLCALRLHFGVTELELVIVGTVEH